MDVVRSIFACTGCQGGGEARLVCFCFFARHPPKAPFLVYGLARRHAGVSVRFPRAGLRLMSFMLSLVVCVGHRSGQRVVLSIFCFSCSFHSRNLVNLINFSAFGGGLLRPCSVLGTRTALPAMLGGVSRARLPAYHFLPHPGLAATPPGEGKRIPPAAPTAWHIVPTASAFPSLQGGVPERRGGGYLFLLSFLSSNNKCLPTMSAGRLAPTSHLSPFTSHLATVSFFRAVPMGVRMRRR